VASRAHVWPDAVSLTAHSALASAYSPHQVRYSNVRAVRIEGVRGSNPLSSAEFLQVRDLVRAPRPQLPRYVSDFGSDLAAQRSCSAVLSSALMALLTWL
jgi:hypothetical protein